MKTLAGIITIVYVVSQLIIGALDGVGETETGSRVQSIEAAAGN